MSKLKTTITRVSHPITARYPKCFIVGADNVGSKQMQEIRIALRGQVGSCKTSFRKLRSVSTAPISTMRTL